VKGVESTGVMRGKLLAELWPKVQKIQELVKKSLFAQNQLAGMGGIASLRCERNECSTIGCSDEGIV
jgi:hypothetical protein